MAKLGINTGSAPDAGDGDSLQQGAIKINSNFDEVYTLLGNGTALAPGIVTSIVGGNNIAVSTSVGQVTLNVTGNTWDDNTTGIHTLSNVGIGTTNATDELKVSGTVKTDQIVVVGVSTFLNDVNFNYDLTIGEDASLERNLKVTGVSTFVGESNFNDSVLIAGITTCSNDLDVSNDIIVGGGVSVADISTFADGIRIGSSSQSIVPSGSNDVTFKNAFTGGAIKLRAAGNVEIQSYQGSTLLKTNTQAVTQGGLSLYYATGLGAESKKLETTNTGVTVTGALNATSFVGDGSGLTGINATGTGVSISDGGSFIGVASAINFGSNLSVSSISAGIVTVTGQAGGGSTANVVTNSLVVSGVSTFAGIITASQIRFGSIGTFTDLNSDMRQANTLTFGDGEMAMFTRLDGANSYSQIVVDNYPLYIGTQGEQSGNYYYTSLLTIDPGNDSGTVGTNDAYSALGHGKNISDGAGGNTLFRLRTTGTGTTAFGDFDVVSGDITATNNIKVSGVSTFTGNVSFASSALFGDSDKILLGSDNDFEIYHDGSNGFIENATGELYIRDTNASGTNRIFIQAKSGEDGIIAYEDGQVELFYDDSKKFETTNTGVTVTGAVNATSFVGDGSGLSGVNATGTGVSAFNSGAFVGVASAFNFADNLTLSPISAGLVTVTAGAASTADVRTNTLNVSGMTTLAMGYYGSGSEVRFYSEESSGGSLSISHAAGNPNGVYMRFASHDGDDATIETDSNANMTIDAGANIHLKVNGDSVLSGTENSGTTLYYSSAPKLGTTSGGINVTGHVETDTLNVSGISSIGGNIIVGHNPSTQGSGSILKANELNLTGPNSGDSNSTYYSNIRANKVGGGFKYDIEFHSNGYSSGDIGDFIFYRRGTSSQRYERMRLSGETGKLTVTGDGSFAGSLISPYTGSTKTYTVTTATKTAAHRYNGTGSGTGYLIDGVEAPFLTLTPGRTYRFTNDNTGSHPLKFYLEADKTTEYTTGVTFNNAYTEITVSDTTPQVLHYQCTNHAYMGNAVNTNTNKVQTPYSASVGAGSSVNGVDSPALTLSHNNPILTGTAGTTGQIKQIGGAPFYYDGSSWREFVLSSGTPVTVPEDTDWDNVIYRNTFDSNFVDAKFNVNGTVGSGATIAGSPVKVGGGSFRIAGNQVGAGVSYPNRSEYNFTGSWTIEGWLFLDSYVSNRDYIIVSMSRHQGASDDDWVFGYYTTSNGNIGFVWNNERDTGATLLKSIPNADVESDWKNKWRHIALVKEGSDGSLHFYVDGVEDSLTANGNTTDNNIVNNNQHSLIIGGIPDSAGPVVNNITYNNNYTGDYSLDDLRITAGVGTAGQRYTSVGSSTAQVFTPSTVALPTTGTLSSNTNPPGDKYGEIVLGGSPSWVGTSGITVSQQSSGNYRLTFATSHTNSNDYFVLTQAMDQGFASYVGVARSTSHVDFSVNRESNDAAVDTGSLSVQIKNHS